MRSRLLASAVVFLSLAEPLANPQLARAQDASFGCKVLLCAAATAPGWAGIPYCVPVMQELFRQLALRRPWPVCSEARTSGIGFEPDAPCSSGRPPAGGEDGLSATDGRQYADRSRSQRLCGSAQGAVCRTAHPTIARPVQPNPDFVDLTAASGTPLAHVSFEGH